MKVIFYESINNVWLYYSPDSSIPEVNVTETTVNLTISLSIYLIHQLNLPYKTSDLSFLFEDPCRAILKHITYFVFFENDIAYIPYPCLGCSMALPDTCPLDLISERYSLFLNVFSSVCSNFSEFSVNQSPDFLLFHCMDYSPWSGISEALYGGHFIKGTEKWNHYYIPKRQFPDLQALHSCKGIVITGSRYCSFNSSYNWIEKLMQIIQFAYTNNKILLGICFGHQIIAKALGGLTSKNPSNKFIYKFEEITSENLNKLIILESHNDCVSRVPRNFEVLFRSSTCEVECLYQQGKILSFQGHPEHSVFFVKHFHARTRVKSGMMSQENFQKFLENSPTTNDSNAIIKVMNEFLRTGVANFEKKEEEKNGSYRL